MATTAIASWVTTMWSGYVEQLLRAGYSAEEADRTIARNADGLFVDGVPNADQRIFHVLDDGVVCGSLWLGRRQEADRGEWYVYDIEIDEVARGGGVGRATMRAAEDYVRSQGGTRLALNVFGHNQIARRLYESLDYDVVAIAMRKELT